MPRIVIAYSKNHFDPEKPRGLLGDSGATLLAKAVFETVRELYPESTITYLDHSEWNGLPKNARADLFFGISSNFSKFVEILKPQESVLIAVNRASRYRRIILTQKRIFAPREPIVLQGHDGIDADGSDLESANKILQLGGWSNFYANALAGVPLSSQSIISFKKDAVPRVEEPTFGQGRHILFLAGSVVFRKGIHVIPELVRQLNRARSTLRVRLVGVTSNKRIEKYFLQLAKKYPEHFIWKNEHIIGDSREWELLFAHATLAISPSFEEGQQDSAMESLRRGVPLLHSMECGIESTVTNSIVSNEHPENWATRVMEVAHDEHELEFIRAAQARLYAAQAEGTSSIYGAIKIHRDSNWKNLNYALMEPQPLSTRSPFQRIAVKDFEQLQLIVRHNLQLKYPNFERVYGSQLDLVRIENSSQPFESSRILVGEGSWLSYLELGENLELS